MAAITKMAIGLVQDRLVGLDFEKRKLGVFSLSIAHDVIGWVGLNKATRGPDTLEINPVVGVRNQRVERLVADLTGTEFDDLLPPTVAGNIGYLSPAHRYMAFVFSDPETVPGVADRLCETIKAYGLPFMTKAADLGSLVQTMQAAQFGMAPQLNYRIPVALWLMPDIAKAREFITMKLSEIGTRDDLAAAHYRAFAAKLNERIEQVAPN